MWQVPDGMVTRFRCHTGHAYYGEDLFAEQGETLEAALWTAVRMFKERTILARQLAIRERERRHQDAAQRFEEDGRRAEEYSTLIQRNMLRVHPEGVPDATEEVSAAPATRSGQETPEFHDAT